jgi:hypothetical protein
MGIGINSYSASLQNSYDDRRELDIGKIQLALERYKSRDPNFSYPITLTSLVPIYMTQLPVDPVNQQPYTAYYTVGSCLTPAPNQGFCTSYQIVVPLEKGYSLVATPLNMKKNPP